MLRCAPLSHGIVPSVRRVSVSTYRLRFYPF
uniref:Uncharacterized protein n=1 Tax=Anguilla anguilla TaxID=7936 RepID=A0A0E9WK45_ANGAN